MCPFTGLIGLGALVGGTERLFQGRRVSKLAVAACAVLIAAAWVVYFAAARTLALRVGLEIASVAFLVLAPAALRAAAPARASRFAALERYATAPAPSCPLGFGGTSRTGSRATADTGVEAHAGEQR